MFTGNCEYWLSLISLQRVDFGRDYKLKKTFVKVLRGRSQQRLLLGPRRWIGRRCFVEEKQVPLLCAQLSYSLTSSSYTQDKQRGGRLGFHTRFRSRGAGPVSALQAHEYCHSTACNKQR